MFQTLLFVALALVDSEVHPPVYPLKKSETGRFLVDQRGKPFLVLGDSAWSLIAQLGNKEIDQYLDDRAKRGFNCLIVNLIEHQFCTNAPATRTKILPFEKAGYFNFAYNVVKKANDRGIAVWLFPAYLGYGGGNEGWFKDMKACGKAKLRNYGRFVGKRFKDLPNLVWVMGGDFTPPQEDQWTVTELAEGILEEDSQHLMTAHGGPSTHSAVIAFGEPDWLTVNSVYSYEKALFRPLLTEYHRPRTRPFVLLESVYEGEHDSKPHEIRRQAYWAMLSGACGQFFGNNPIWHFDGPGLFPFTTTWQKAMDGTGSRDMVRLRRLFVEIPWQQLAPDENHIIVTKGYGKDLSSVLTSKAPDRSMAIIYVPSTEVKSQSLTVNLAQFSGPVTARWYNPTDGRFMAISDQTFPNLGLRDFQTPGDNGTGAFDWLLILKLR